MDAQATDGLDGEALREFFVGHGLALGAGDLETISEHVDLPVLLADQEASTLLRSPEEVRDLPPRRVSGRTTAAAVAVVPEVAALEEVGWALLWVQVRWSFRDELAAELASTRVRYLVRRGRGTFEICALAPLPD